jgi:hypothetical protein
MADFLYTFFFYDAIMKHESHLTGFLRDWRSSRERASIDAWKGVYQLVGNVPRCGRRSIP